MERFFYINWYIVSLFFRAVSIYKEKVKEMNKKQVVIINKSQLKRIVVESVKRILMHESQTIANDIDKAYMDAVSRGDMKTAQRMVIDAAKMAMPNTKVVDEKGNPLVVYHRTPNEFNEFDRGRIGSNTDSGAFGSGFYFSPNDNYGLYGRNKMALFIDATNPMMLNDGNAYEEKRKYMQDDVTFGAEESRKMSEGIQEEGYDGVIYNDGYGTIEIVAFNPNQIKSADPVTYDDKGNIIPLSERFNLSNNDIRYEE